MPELPEVETVKRGLERTVMGKTVQSVDVRVPKIFPHDREVIDSSLVGQRIEGVERRGKVLLIHLSNSFTLAIHLKMTGQLVVKPREVPSTLPLRQAGKSQEPNKIQDPNFKSQPRSLGTGFIAGHPEKSYEQPLPHKHTHVVITFADGTVLYFNDLRKFGWFRLVPSHRMDQFLADMKHGPEPLSDKFTVDYLHQLAKKRSIPIKTFLLDQSVIAGVGNIYADEALFESRIRPTRKAKSLTRAQIERLHAAIRRVLELGIKHGGTTLNTYRNVEGTAGKMRDYLKVYDREGQRCLREDTPPTLKVGGVCPGTIKRIKIGQRSSHFCPNCQG